MYYYKNKSCSKYKNKAVNKISFCNNNFSKSYSPCILFEMHKNGRKSAFKDIYVQLKSTYLDNYKNKKGLSQNNLRAYTFLLELINKYLIYATKTDNIYTY